MDLGRRSGKKLNSSYLELSNSPVNLLKFIDIETDERFDLIAKILGLTETADTTDADGNPEKYPKEIINFFIRIMRCNIFKPIKIIATDENFMSLLSDEADFILLSTK